jgi:NAD(P)-dependent dehydrogenase (short-subunit alcohol dehydrogenase family)
MSPEPPPELRDMAGRVCAVTGASAGIGRETALGLARLGATVALVVRSRERGEAARAWIRERVPNADVHLVMGDLAVQGGVRAAAAALLERFERLDVLVNNAATFHWRRRTTPDGLEAQLAVNHLAPFLLTGLVLDRLRASAPARIVTVSSGAHRHGAFRPDDLQATDRYFGPRKYADTKLYNLLFTRELARRTAGMGVTATAVHPGPVGTSLVFDGFPPLRLFRGLLRTPEEGARTVLYLAASAAVEGASGGYYKDETAIDPAPAAKDDEAARTLWLLSERLTGTGS